MVQDCCRTLKGPDDDFVRSSRKAAVCLYLCVEHFGHGLHTIFNLSVSARTVWLAMAHNNAIFSHHCGHQTVLQLPSVVTLIRPGFIPLLFRLASKDGPQTLRMCVRR